VYIGIRFQSNPLLEEHCNSGVPVPESLLQQFQSNPLLEEHCNCLLIFGLLCAVIVPPFREPLSWSPHSACFQRAFQPKWLIFLHRGFSSLFIPTGGSRSSK
jgi:hypothetical protein